jgi:hypothetical protein
MMRMNDLRCILLLFGGCFSAAALVVLIYENVFGEWPWETDQRADREFEYRQKIGEEYINKIKRGK